MKIVLKQEYHLSDNINTILTSTFLYLNMVLVRNEKPRFTKKYSGRKVSMEKKSSSLEFNNRLRIDVH